MSQFQESPKRHDAGVPAQQGDGRLLAQVDHEDVEVRRLSLEALGARALSLEPREFAFLLLNRALRDPAAEVRDAAVRALAKLSAHQGAVDALVIPALLAALRDRAGMVREHALLTLAAWGARVDTCIPALAGCASLFPGLGQTTSAGSIENVVMIAGGETGRARYDEIRRIVSTGYRVAALPRRLAEAVNPRLLTKFDVSWEEKIAALYCYEGSAANDSDVYARARLYGVRAVEASAIEPRQMLEAGLGFIFNARDGAGTGASAALRALERGSFLDDRVVAVVALAVLESSAEHRSCRTVAAEVLCSLWRRTTPEVRDLVLKAIAQFVALPVGTIGRIGDTDGGAQGETIEQSSEQALDDEPRQARDHLAVASRALEILGEAAASGCASFRERAITSLASIAVADSGQLSAAALSTLSCTHGVVAQSRQAARVVAYQARDLYSRAAALRVLGEPLGDHASTVAQVGKQAGHPAFNQLLGELKGLTPSQHAEVLTSSLDVVVVLGRRGLLGLLVRSEGEALALVGSLRDRRDLRADSEAAELLFFHCAREGYRRALEVATTEFNPLPDEIDSVLLGKDGGSETVRAGLIFFTLTTTSRRGLAQAFRLLSVHEQVEVALRLCEQPHHEAVEALTTALGPMAVDYQGNLAPHIDAMRLTVVQRNVELPVAWRAAMLEIIEDHTGRGFKPSPETLDALFRCLVERRAASIRDFAENALKVFSRGTWQDGPITCFLRRAMARISRLGETRRRADPAMSMIVAPSQSWIRAIPHPAERAIARALATPEPAQAEYAEIAARAYLSVAATREHTAFQALSAIFQATPSLAVASLIREFVPGVRWRGQ